jgi:AraC-like DNA-binding protein
VKRFIRSASLTNYAEIAASAGLDPPRMLEEFGLPPQCLMEPELKVPIDVVRNLLETSAERSGVEAFGLLMAEKRRLAHLGPLGLLMREQPTMHHALQALARYANRMNQAMFLTLEEAGDVVVLREELIVGGSGSIRQSTELAIGVVFLSVQALLGDAWKPRRVCFAHDPPEKRTVHERIFGPIVEFGHDFNGIVCARRDLAIRNPQADPVMARYARDMMESSFSGRSLMTDQMREIVLTQLASGKCSIDLAARQLGVSRRTVHRALEREGHTFSQIVDDVRRELASRYVADKHRSLSEVSELLGFAAPSGFSRWYRRHFKAPASRKRVGAVRRPRRAAAK